MIPLDPVERRKRAIERWERWMRRRHVPRLYEHKAALHAMCENNGGHVDFLHTPRIDPFMCVRPSYYLCQRCGRTRKEEP